MTDTVFMTGATGFLGTELAARLIQNPDSRIYALVRATNGAEARHRLKSAWRPMEELRGAVGKQVFPIPGDFTKPNLGMDANAAGKLRENVTLVLHAGAEIGFQKSERELTAANVLGTQNTLDFAAQIKSLRRFVHISTAYVAGQKSGVVTEAEPVGTAFSSLYEKSKAAAEALVRESALPFSVCRPGMIVGDSKSGWIRNFNTVYYILKLMLLGDLRILPIRPETALNIVPGDYVADAVMQIIASGEAEGKTFHLTCPKEAAPRAGELAEYVRDWAARNLSVTLPKPVFLPLSALKRAGLLYNRKEDGRKKGYVSNLLTLLPYFFGEQDFDRTNTNSVCGPFQIQWRDYIDALLTFACRKNFMRQTGQTVFEQARVRRESARYPVSYYNVTISGAEKVTGAEANRRIDKITRALWAWGVRKGDRVALTGVNSVEYMTLEQALGLLGAVSVPIYYTTPAPDAAALLAQSGAEWFFIGDRRMMEGVDRMDATARLVSFSDGQLIDCPRVMRWEAFLEKGVEPAPAQYPEPDDLATIRYTSGTTGTPKGVMFTFGQLAWMGEVLTNLLPWNDRNRPLRYLSFLPLSHVVEGILASYAPYYLLARVDFYYLNDFGTLADALPKVRPTVFFSVPRFYEKLWNRLISSAIGKIWFAANEGLLKQALAFVLRKTLLKKAGLDRCGQLITGSAPVSETLLLRFRSLGIEIHNAYGQTEAPLVTLNRVGDNVIPTIGAPLPDTEITLGADGELIVKGPQTTAGYYGLESANIQGGVLYTGDLGVIHDSGYVILRGRKKDMIITAYGKNISIAKIEARLKNIPGVTEAVLIGENRPYCTALLWLENKIPDLDARIGQANAELSRPEQIRRYRVISRPLSIEKGELTPNLKVKRDSVEAHFAREIEELYR